LPEVLVDDACVIPPPVCTLPEVLVGDECVIPSDPPTDSKQEQKLAVINDLTALKDSTDKKTDKKINKAIKHIERS